MGQGPGPGPLGPGAWGPLGPRCGIRVENVTTDCQAGYLLSGKLPTIRQATYYQASYLLSGMHPNVAADFAPNNRIHAPNRSIDMHPKGIDMHPKLSIDLHPTSAYSAPKRFRIHAPNNRIHSPNRFGVICHSQVLKKSVKPYFCILWTKN